MMEKPDTDGRSTRHGRNGIPAIVTPAMGNSVCPAWRMPLRAAIPVLLDGNDLLQVERGAGVARRQPVLDRAPDPGPFREAPVSHRVPAMAVEHDPDFGGLALHLPVRGSTGRLCHRAPALQGRAPGRPVDFLRLPRAAVDPVHPAGTHSLQARIVRHYLGADPYISDLSDPVLHLAADGVFPYHSLRAGGMRADRRRDPLAVPGKDHAAARRP